MKNLSEKPLKPGTLFLSLFFFFRDSSWREKDASKQAGMKLVRSLPQSLGWGQIAACWCLLPDGRRWRRGCDVGCLYLATPNNEIIRRTFVACFGCLSAEVHVTRDHSLRKNNNITRARLPSFLTLSSFRFSPFNYHKRWVLFFHLYFEWQKI